MIVSSGYAMIIHSPNCQWLKIAKVYFGFFLGGLLGLAGNCNLVLTQPLLSGCCQKHSHTAGREYHSLQEYQEASGQKKGIYLLISHWTKQVTWPYPASRGRKKYNSITCMDREVNQSLGGCPCRLPQSADASVMHILHGPGSPCA